MPKFSCVGFLAAGLLVLSLVRANAVTNPDQVVVYFPVFESIGNLGENVATVLALQLAQTMRSRPWPENPNNENFGEGMVRYTGEKLDALTHDAAASAAQRIDLRAQIVVWGWTARYGADVVVDVNVTLPRYRAAPSIGCSRREVLKCDFRVKNFERWTVVKEGNEFIVDVPARRFSLSPIVLKSSIVERFSEATGLKIMSRPNGGQVLGTTGENWQFREFIGEVGGGLALVRSGGTLGYVTLPELSREATSFSSTVGGILQFYRGDWERAVESFSDVLANPATQVPNRVDALLFRGAAKFRMGRDGRSDFDAAAKLAPYDRTVVRYQLMGAISTGDATLAEQLISGNSFLFVSHDEWLHRVGGWLEGS